jgi:signal transduction histidine kinase
MLLETEDDAAKEKAARKIRSVSEQMRTVLSGLQQYIWLIEAPVVWTRLDLNQLMDEVIQKLRKAYPAVKIKVEMETLPELLADKKQVLHLFEEVFSNAIRFRKAEDEVLLQINASRLQLNRYRSISGKYQFSPNLKIEVRDSGVGFDPAYKEQAFGLFKRLHQKNSGSGIGLSLCKKIVENHKGTISIDSLPGEGTVVTIVLPQDEVTAVEMQPDITKKTSTINDG